MLNGQVEAMEAAQLKERQMISEFAALAEEHVMATAAPLAQAQQDLRQVMRPACFLYACTL